MTMKTYFYYIILLGVALLSACSGEELQGTPSKETLEVKDTVQYLEHSSESYSIPVTANCPWNVELLSGWEDLTLGTRSGSGNDHIKLITSKNDLPTTREAFLLVTSQTGVIVRKIHVFQTGKDP